MIRCYDASRPSKNPPPWRICAFYIGGNTPHVWTPDEIKADKARYGLPIFVHTGVNTELSGQADGRQIVSALTMHHIPVHSTVTIDTEDTVYSDYLLGIDRVVSGAGYHLMNYGSEDAIIHNPLLSGGRWSAHWDKVPVLDEIPGERGKQYADAAILGTDYDASVFEDGISLWVKNPPHGPPVTTWEELCLNHVEASLSHSAQAAALLKSHGG